MDATVKTKNPHDKAKKKRLPTFNIVNGFLLLLLIIICFIPIMHLVSLSLSNKLDAVAGNVGIFPKGFNLAAYQYVMESSDFWRALSITVLRVIIGVPASLFVVLLSAYALSKPVSRFRARNIFSGFFVFTMLFGGGMIPSYIVISKLGMLNTIWALTIPGAMNIGYMIMMMNFFRGIPTEIEEAATIDGAGQFRILFTLYLPMSLPSLATILLFSTVANWNCWMDGYLYMNKPTNYPLQTYLAVLLMNSKSTLDMAMTPEQIKRMEQTSERTIEAAQIFLAALPIMCFYPFLQKYYIKGIVVGSVKG